MKLRRFMYDRLFQNNVMAKYCPYRQTRHIDSMIISDLKKSADESIYKNSNSLKTTVISCLSIITAWPKFGNNVILKDAIIYKDKTAYKKRH